MNGKYPLFLAADVSRAVLCAVWDRKEEKRKQPHKVDCVSGVWTKKEPVRVFFCSKGNFFFLSCVGSNPREEKIVICIEEFGSCYKEKISVHPVVGEIGEPGKTREGIK